MKKWKKKGMMFYGFLLFYDDFMFFMCFFEVFWVKLLFFGLLYDFVL